MIRALAIGLGLATLCSAGSAEPPQAIIANQQLRLKIYLPDAQNGFYRGTRFDWSGVISDLEFAGHHLYRPWFSSVDPSIRDFTYRDGAVVAAPNSAMTGPAEEFQTPIGYDKAQPGETFLKVGVGILRKPDDTPYQFGKHFDLVDGGKWTSSTTPTSITFEQTLNSSDGQYGYIYTKTIRLVHQTSSFVIEHHLRNTGKAAISTRLYDHNFLTIDQVRVGDGYTISTPYTIHPERAPDAKFVSIQGSTATYTANLGEQDRVAFGLQGFSANPSDYDFTVANRLAGVQIRIQGNRPLVNASVWSIQPVLAVEPFIQIEVAPGSESAWTYTYTYSSLPNER